MSDEGRVNKPCLTLAGPLADLLAALLAPGGLEAVRSKTADSSERCIRFNLTAE